LPTLHLPRATRRLTPFTVLSLAAALQSGGNGSHIPSTTRPNLMCTTYRF